MERECAVKKKRIALIIGLLLAAWAGWQFGVWVAVFSIVAVVVLLTALRGVRYFLAHRGLEELAEVGAPYRMDRAIEKLKASEQTDAPFRFAVLGDNRNTTKIPPMMHRQIKSEDPLFMFNTGDIARFGSAAEYMKTYLPLMEIMEPAPIFGVPGNHDRGVREDFAAFIALHGDERFSFDYGPCRFVGVNNSKRSRISEDDLTYLEHELGKSPIQYKFVFIHIPPRFFEDGIIIGDKRRGFKKRQDEFQAVMKKHNVNEVFMAHIHGYATKEVDGVRYTLTAGAGAPLTKTLPEEGRANHYLLFNVDANNLKREIVFYKDDAWLRVDPGENRD